MPTPPDHPIGPWTSIEHYDALTKDRLIDAMRRTPARLRKTVAGLDDSQLASCYKNWTIRQIVHHIADSHVHSYIRFKWALTECNPTIKAYEEADWVLLGDSQCGEIAPSLALLDGLHAKWVQVLSLLSADQFGRTFVHPQTRETVSLWSALDYYAWHGEHHLGQIRWLRDQNDW